MFVYNLSLNKTKIFKIIFILIVIILSILFLVSAYKIFKTPQPESNNPEINIANITANNYTNILKAVHDNIDTYLGQTLKFSGYVYKTDDFKENQFVLARDMQIENGQTLIVGFLCEFENAKDFPDKTWVEITGTIEKGNYHGLIPILKIHKINKIEKPKDDIVLPPDDFYIPTSSLYYKED